MITMLLSDALAKIDTLYLILQDADTTAKRYTILSQIDDVITQCPATKKFWKRSDSPYQIAKRIWKIREYTIAEIKAQETPQTSFIDEQGILSDGINYNAPNHKGLYLIGETHFNPFTDEKFYALKIGKSDRNLSDRMKTYDTHNPMLWRIDYLNQPNLEKTYQVMLSKIAIARCSHNKEWYFVDRDTYLAVCNQGFSYFDVNTLLF